MARSFELSANSSDWMVVEVSEDKMLQYLGQMVRLTRKEFGRPYQNRAHPVAPALSAVLKEPTKWENDVFLSKLACPCR